MNGPIPTMFDMFSAVAGNSPMRRSRVGGDVTARDYNE